MLEAIGSTILMIIIMMFGALVYQVWLDRDIWKNTYNTSDEEFDTMLDNHINEQDWK